MESGEGPDNPGPPAAQRLAGAMEDQIRRYRMPVKKTTKKATTKVKKGASYTCGICGYRIIVDEACGCAEEHVFICCSKNMKKNAPKKTAKKK